MPRLTRRLVSAFGALLFVGCSGGEIDTGSTAAGGSNAGAAAIAGAGTGGSSGLAGASAGGGTGGIPAVAGSGSGGALACSSYADAAGWSLKVHIENKMSAPLYLGPETMSCQVERPFEVQDGSRAVLASLDGCHTSCDAMMSSGPVACPLNCAVPSTITLKPGQAIDLPWDGRFGVTQTLPAACLHGSQTSPATCIQAQQIEAAAFTFVAHAGSHLQCLDPSGTCTCVPSSNGSCTTASSLISGTIYTTEFLIKLEPGEPPFIDLAFK